MLRSNRILGTLYHLKHMNVVEIFGMWKLLPFQILKCKEFWGKMYTKMPRNAQTGFSSVFAQRLNHEMVFRPTYTVKVCLIIEVYIIILITVQKKTAFDWTLISDKHFNDTSVLLLRRKNIKDIKENLKSFLPPIHDQIFFDNLIIFLMMSHNSWEQETIPTKKI